MQYSIDARKCLCWYRPLEVASITSCCMLAEFLIAQNATVPKDLAHDNTIIKGQKNQAKLNTAVADNNLQGVIHCLRNGVYCNKVAKAFINSKLFDLVQADDATTLIDLIRCGFGLYARDDKGNTLLHFAIGGRKNKVTSLLIYLLHKVQLLDKYLLKTNNAGFTPLDLALNHHATNPILTALCCGTRLPDNAGRCTIS